MKEGSLIFCDVLPIVNKVTGLYWSHVMIYLDGYFYEATPPVVRKISNMPHVKRSLVVEPKQPYTNEQIARMLAYAEANLGRPYRVRGYLFPRRYGKTRGIYCSQFACDALRAGGVALDFRAGYSPDTLYEAMINV